MSTAVARAENNAAESPRRATAHAHQRYALALVELAEAQGALSAVERDMAALGSTIEGSGDLQRILRHPLIDRGQQTRVLQTVATRLNAHELTKKFLAFVAAKRRQAILGAIIAAIADECAARRGEIVANVTSAAPLSLAQQDELARLLSAKHKADVKLKVAVDPSLIGGMVIKVGAQLYDRTIKAQLNILQQRLGAAA